MESSSSKGSSKRKPAFTMKVKMSKKRIESDSDVDSDYSDKKESKKKGKSSKGDTSQSDIDSIPDLPEGTVVVKPEAVKEKKPRFSGPEFSKTPENLDIVNCTSCGRQINPNVSGAAKRHPALNVLVCRKCYSYYKSGKIEQDEDGLDEQCRWCGEGGRLSGCDYCHNAFCKSCIIRNFSRSEFTKVMSEDGPKWKCYVCEPAKLKKLVQDCDQLFKKIEKEKMKAKMQKENPDSKKAGGGSSSRSSRASSGKVNKDLFASITVNSTNLVDTVSQVLGLTEGFQTMLEVLKAELSTSGDVENSSRDKARGGKKLEAGLQQYLNSLHGVISGGGGSRGKHGLENGETTGDESMVSGAASQSDEEQLSPKPKKKNAEISRNRTRVKEDLDDSCEIVDVPESPKSVVDILDSDESMDDLPVRFTSAKSSTPSKKEKSKDKISDTNTSSFIGESENEAAQLELLKELAEEMCKDQKQRKEKDMDETKDEENKEHETVKGNENKKPENKDANKITDTEDSDTCKETDTKNSDKKTDTKNSDKKTDKKNADKKTDKKDSEKKTEKQNSDKTDKKDSDKKTPKKGDKEKSEKGKIVKEKVETKSDSDNESLNSDVSSSDLLMSSDGSVNNSQRKRRVQRKDKDHRKSSLTSPREESRKRKKEKKRRKEEKYRSPKLKLPKKKRAFSDSDSDIDLDAEIDKFVKAPKSSKKKKKKDSESDDNDSEDSDTSVTMDTKNSSDKPEKSSIKPKGKSKKKVESSDSDDDDAGDDNVDEVDEEEEEDEAPKSKLKNGKSSASSNGVDLENEMAKKALMEEVEDEDDVEKNKNGDKDDSDSDLEPEVKSKKKTKNMKEESKGKGGKKGKKVDSDFDDKVSEDSDDKGDDSDDEGESDDDSDAVPKKKKKHSKLLSAKISDSESDAKKKKSKKKKAVDDSDDDSDVIDSRKKGKKKQKEKEKKKKKGTKRKKGSESDSLSVSSSSSSEPSDSEVSLDTSEEERREKLKEERKAKRKAWKSKRKRIKEQENSSDEEIDGEKTPDDDDDDDDDEDDEGKSPDKSGRKNIRKIKSDKKLTDATKKARKVEELRRKRVAERQKEFNHVITEEDPVTSCPVTTQLILEHDKETKKPILEVNRKLVRKLKPHQVEACKFMWDCLCESLDRMKKKEGSGCILAHCMGLGKTLSVISFVHTMLANEELTKLRTVLIVCPLNTVINWRNEWLMWFEEKDQLDVYEISSVKQNWPRADYLKDWQEGGGIMIIGYEMYRNLTMSARIKNKKLKAIFQSTLVDPGPDLVVCDEGHILKNDASAVSQALNRVRSRRRIVLTGTPLQNNLVEYHCMTSFVKPNLMGTRKEFLNRFVNPITNGQHKDSTAYDVKVMGRRAHVLHEMLAGCVQRRDYSALTKFLPPKFEYVMSVRMMPKQIELYQKYLELGGIGQEGVGGTTKGARLFSDYQNLMKIWTHPWLLKLSEIRAEQRAKYDDDSEDSFVDNSTEEESMSGSESDSSSVRGKDSDESQEAGPSSGARRSRRGKPPKEDSDKDEVVKDWKTKSRGRDGSDDDIQMMVDEGPRPVSKEWWAEFVKEEDECNMSLSGKLMLLFEILKMCEEIGDKVLIFSQSLLSLDIIEYFLDYIDKQAQEEAHAKMVAEKEAREAEKKKEEGEKKEGEEGEKKDGDTKDGEDGEKKEEEEEVKEEFGKCWTKGADYFRMDGSTSPQLRSQWSDHFNDPENYRSRLFLISTRAGSLGINLVAANRVIIFDASWNPSHDVQSIFRVYRFGQTKPCYIYRFLGQGTMEEKIYERQVTKQSLSQRVVDEHQIDRHFTANDLTELYNFKPDRLDDPNREKVVHSLPKDVLLAELLKSKDDFIYKFHEHDSLLENRTDQVLSEEDKKAAWEDYENDRKGVSNRVAQASKASGMGMFSPDNVMQIVQMVKMRFPNLPPDLFQAQVQAILQQQILYQQSIQKQQIETQRMMEMQRLHRIQQNIRAQQQQINHMAARNQQGGAAGHARAPGQIMSSSNLRNMLQQPGVSSNSGSRSTTPNTPPAVIDLSNS